MKKILLIATLLFISVAMNAQRFAYVDTEYILSNIPSYKAAQDKLNKLSLDWQKEIETEYEKVDEAFKEYQAEKVLLTSDLKKQREAEIAAKEKAVKDLQKRYFGANGELFKKRQELVKPIQDEVFNVIKDIAKSGNYAVIFDTASGATILFTDPKFDKSDEVLEKLGYKN